MRIGLIADTHDELVAWDEVLARVAVAFDGVELILHCGDLTTMRALDDLAGLAPVVAVRSDADPPPAPPRLLDGPHVLDAGDVTIGLVNTLGDPPVVPAFGRDVEVVVHGGTHTASVERRDGVLLVNPGSPSLAEACTVAVLTVEPSATGAEVLAVDAPG
jgi:putative phosphoesterase